MAIAGSFAPTALQAQSAQPVTVELASLAAASAARANTLPQIRIVIPDMKMCPGQEYDIPVYIEISDTNTTIHSFTLGFRFPDYEILEPTGHISDVYEPIRNLGQIASTYSQTAVYNLPDHSFRLNWFQNDPKKPLKVKSGQLLFRFRAKYKKDGETKIDFVGGHSCPDAYLFSHFSINANENTISDNAKTIPDILPWSAWEKREISDTILYTSANIRPGEPFNISIMPDTLMCVGNAIRFWAEGGERYEWKDVSGMERPYAKSMDDPRDQNPLFKPQEPGIYTFQCKIIDKQGCVGYLYTHCNVRDNSLFLEVPADTMINANSQALSSVAFWNSPDHHYVTRWTPGGVIEGSSLLDVYTGDYDVKQKMYAIKKTKKLNKSQWITIDLNDDFCRLQKVQNVNVKGAPVEGEIILDPPTVCLIPGKEGQGMPVKVNVRAHGGSGGPYHYLWSAENIEKDNVTTWDPIWMNDANRISSQVKVYKSCVVRVNVIDYNGKTTATITDTIHAIKAAPVSFAIEDVEGKDNTFCEKSARIFAAHAVNAQNPKFEWYINDMEVLRTADTFFTTSALRVGDKVHCVMKNSGECVSESELLSQSLYPPAVYPSYMSVMPGYGPDAVNNNAVDEYVSLNIAHRHTGKSFRLRWYSNDRTLLYDQKITNPKAPEDTTLNHSVNVERTGYYDYYRAVVTGSDRACLVTDSLTTAAVQNFNEPRLSPINPAQSGSVYMDKSVEAGVCKGDGFSAYTYDLKYLPKNFRLVWKVDHVNHPDGLQTESVGYYATPGSVYANCESCGTYLGNIDKYNATDPFTRVQNWVLGGFEVNLIEGNDSPYGKIHGGDSLYYVIEARDPLTNAVVETQSSKKVLKTLPTVWDYPDPSFVSDKDHLQRCEGEIFRFFPKLPSSDSIRYTWYVDGREIVPQQESNRDNTSAGSDEWTVGEVQHKIRYPEIHGDTLVSQLFNNIDVRLRATNSYQCYKLPVRYAESVLTPSKMYSGFRIVRSNDTLVCSGDSVALWAYGESYRVKPGVIRRPTKPGVPDFLSEYEGKIKMTWAYSMEDLLEERTIDTGLCIKVALDSAAFGDRSADYNNPDAVVGRERYYLRMTNYESGCTSYDSIDVAVGYQRTPSIVITPVPAFPWCENTTGAHFKLSGALWGTPDSLRVRILSSIDYWYRVGEERSDSLPYAPSVMKPGGLVEFKVNNPLAKSCSHQSTGYASIKLDIRGATMGFVRADSLPSEHLRPVVCVGDSVVLEGFGATLAELQAASGKRLKVDQIIDRLHGGYTYKWVDEASGDTIGEGRFLKVGPTVPTTYKLIAQDTARRCAAGQGSATTRMAVSTDIDIKFFDPVLKKEVPLSLCPGSASAQLSFRAYPQHFTRNASLGFVVYSNGDLKNPRQKWSIRNVDSVMTAEFRPGDVFKYAYVHDTLACSGKTSTIKTTEVQTRPVSYSFVAMPDTLLCGEDAHTTLHLEGAKRNASELPAGSPVLKNYLAAQGVAGASSLPSSAMVYWTTGQDGLSEADKTSFSPLVNPANKAIYHAWGYNEYGCIQTDSARVERLSRAGRIDFKLTLPVDSVLCEADSLWFALDRYESSILSLFDSLVWKRIPVEKLATTDSGQPSGTINAEGVEILNTNFKMNRIYAHVNHGDVVYVDGHISKEKLCDNVISEKDWYRSNKIVVKSYKRPKLVLAQLEEACADSTLRLKAQTTALHVRWLDDLSSASASTARYEIQGSKEGQTALVKTISRENGDDTTTIYAEAYEHPVCVTRAGVEVKIKSLSDQSLSISGRANVCNDDPVPVRIKAYENVETWHWVLAPKNAPARDMTFKDFDSDDEYVIQDFLSNALTLFTAPFQSGDRVWAEGHTTARCVSSYVVNSDTLTILRGAQPEIVWLEPAFKAKDARELEGCAGEELRLRWKLTKANQLRGLAWEGGTQKQIDLSFVGNQDGGMIYEWVGAYPQTPAGSSANGEMKLQVLADAGNCTAVDSLHLVSHSKDSLQIEIAATVSTICQGEEATYGLLRREHIDSVIWYHNGMRMKSGPLATTASYTCRPNPGDRVWAKGFNRTSACALNNGVVSNTISINVIAGGRKPVGMLSANLSVSADSVCGTGKPVYTLRGKGFDSVYWFANGEWVAYTAATGITTNPEECVATWARTSALVLGTDSVYAVAVRTERFCAERDSVITKTVAVHHREMPEVRILERDASAWPGKDVNLSATGASHYIWWTDMERGIAGLEPTFDFTMIADTVGVFVMGYEPAYDSLGFAGGAALRPAANAYSKFGCRSRDQVNVSPTTVPEGEVMIYIPNAVLLNSTRAADRVFKVFGERIAEVQMRIFNGGGDLVFSKTDKDPVWNPQNATTGNYTYRLVITMKNGEKIEKNGWISVLE